MTLISKKTTIPEVTISATRVGKIALIAAISNEKEEESIKQVVDGLDDIKLAVTFVSGKTNKVKDTFIQSLIGCALQNKIITKKRATFMRQFMLDLKL
uniref:Hut operon positive regulatory protein n=1 Tax=Malonomonas rubra TaxID=57040 RepID=O06920_MALRU|nr:MadY [Malonomonas rubra]